LQGSLASVASLHRSAPESVRRRQTEIADLDLKVMQLVRAEPPVLLLGDGDASASLSLSLSLRELADGKLSLCE